MNSKIVSNPAGERFASFSRRSFLRGLGACVALPAFESLRPWRALGANEAVGGLASTATRAPLRTLFVSFPNGAIPSSFWPAEDGKQFQFSPTLKPLEAVRDHIQVLGGLNHNTANPGPDGAGDHARGSATFLTGVRLKKSATDIRAGVSIDQVLARAAGHLTRFRSLELSCDASRNSGACDSGYACAYQYNISWSSPTTPMAAEANPRMVFERLFGGGGSGQRAENFRRRQNEQRSILDFVLEDAREMQRRLDGRDRDKLDQYLTGVRDIESRIQEAERFGDVKDPDVSTPPGVPSEYGEHVQLMFDILLLAFQTDSTRIGTLLLAHDGSNRSFSEIGVPEGHHDLSHHFDNPDKIQKVAEIDLWYVRQFSKFLQKLEQTRDTDGNSLLYNSMVLYGSGNADGNRHTHANLPLILAGHGGGTLTTGRFIKYDSKPTTNLFLSMAERFGVKDLEQFGDSTGRLENV